MIEETGQVVECQGRFAWVETRRASTCGSCSASKGCGTATLAKVLGQRRTRTRVLNDLGAGVGDEVVVGLPEQALVRGALAVYLVPLLGLLAGGLFGAYLAQRLLVADPELFTMALGGLGLAGGVVWLRRFARSIGEDSRYQPVILRRAAAPVPPSLPLGSAGH